jgi:hypothetical protein
VASDVLGRARALGTLIPDRGPVPATIRRKGSRIVEVVIAKDGEEGYTMSREHMARLAYNL